MILILRLAFPDGLSIQARQALIAIWRALEQDLQYIATILNDRSTLDMQRKATPTEPTNRRGDRGRPREFDLEKVTGLAAETFWKHGYHATSIETLCEATGLMGGRLYGAFCDKHGLLVAAFESYVAGAVARLHERLDAKLPPKEALREALLHYTRVASKLTRRHGCFITNATLELLPGDSVLRPHIEEALKRIAQLLAKAVTRGQNVGVFDANLEEQAVGHFLLCTVQGLRVLGKVSLDEQELISIVEMAMRALA